MNIIEQAVKMKLRFDTNRGQLSVEQIYDLPLNTRNNTEGLKDLARQLNSIIKAEDDLFESTTANKINKLRFDIVMQIIAERQAEAAKLVERKSLESQLEQFTEILNAKKNDAMKDLSVEELEAKIAEIKSKH